jgi:hypothetical protein
MFKQCGLAALVALAFSLVRPVCAEGETMTAGARIIPPLPRLPQNAATAPRAYRAADALALENERTRVVFPHAQACPAAVWFSYDGHRYSQLAVTAPLSEITYEQPDGSRQTVVVKPGRSFLSQGDGTASVAFEWTHASVGGATLSGRLDFRLRSGSARVTVAYEMSTDGALKLLRFTGPSVYAGEGAFGAEKSFALFPGLEYLQGDEPSSSRRDAAEPISLRLVPHPFKVTMPLMAVSHAQDLVALLWDQRQSWDGEDPTLSAEFASPNWREKSDNHLMRLFIPTVPQWVPENGELAETPYELRAGRKLRMTAYVVAEHVAHALPEETVLRAIDHYYHAVGVPPVPPRPRPLQAEIELSRYAFINTVWDEASKKSRHCVDWAPANSPGFATLLWIDYLHARDPKTKAELLERVALIASQTMADAGESGLASPANCHILRWEFPFYRGHLAGGLAGAAAQVRATTASQQRDGSWRFDPDEKRRSLGKFGDSEIGLCARPALDLLRYARITGDRACLAAGLKALEFMGRFSIPRGAQSWECPLYEPDILAAGYAIPANVEAYRVTGDRRFLAQAVYWAKTGLPFLFAWNRPDTPGMLYASIPVFGTTFYTHSWLGIPVQWNGLVYAYGLQHLARYDASMPWKHIAEGITTSGTWQQVADEGKLKGTYCDGWYEHMTDKRGAWINPEDIMVNLFALMGFDPDVSTAIVPDPIVQPEPQARVTISSGARVAEAERARGAISFRLRYFEGENSYTLVAGIQEPTRITIDGKAIPSGDLDSNDNAWQYDAQRARLILQFKHAQPEIAVGIQAGLAGA